MAATAEAAALSEAHRRAQARNAAAVGLIVARYWSVVSVDDLASTSRVWLEAILPLIRSRREFSAALTARYLAQFRILELGPGLREQIVFTPAAFTPDVEAMIRASLSVTGPVALQRRLRELPRQPDHPVTGAKDPATERNVADALRQSGTGAAAAAVRHVQNGGRDTAADAITKTALGFLRVTRADPCYFCAMLASRGPVYRGDSFDRSDPRFADGAEAGNYKVHDSCGCQLEPVYRRDAEQLGRSGEFGALWSAATEGAYGSEMVRAFRRAYEGRVR